MAKGLRYLTPMKFRIETKPPVEGFYWTYREVVEVTNTEDVEAARQSVYNWGKAQYPKLSVYVGTVPYFFHSDKIIKA